MHPTSPPSPSATHYPVGAWTALRSLLRLAAAVLCLITSLSQQAQANGLDVAPGFKPSVKFTESLQEVAAPGTPEGVRTLTTSTLTLVANIEGVDLTTITPETLLDFAVGGLSFSRTLREDPAYRVGKTSAVFAFGVNSAGNPDASKASLRASWTAKRLTLTVTLGPAAVTAPRVLMADQQYGQPASPKLYLTSLCRFSFANGEGERTLYVTGSHTIQNTTVSGIPAELNTIKLSGVFDVVPPVITLRNLKAGMTVDDTSPPFSFTATDAITLGNPEGTLQVSIGTGPGNMDIWNPGQFDHLLYGAWDITSVGIHELILPSSLPYGRSFIQVRAQDLDGNVATTAPIPVYKRFPAGLAGRWEGALIAGGPGSITFIADQRGYILSGRLRYLTFDTDEVGYTGTYLSVPFSGFFMGSPHGFLIPRRGASTLRLYITSPELRDPASDSVCGAGVFESSDDTSYFRGTGEGIYRAPYSTHNPAPELLRGRYHLGYDTQPQFPFHGHGFTALNRSPSGSVIFTGRVPDGAAYTGSLAMGPRGEVTIIAPLYGGKGSVWWRTTPTDGDIQGLYGEWFRPQSLVSPTWPWALRHRQEGHGSRYTPPTAGQNFLGQTTPSSTLTSGWTFPVVTPPLDWMGVEIPEIPLTFTTTSLTQGVGQAPNYTSARITHMDRATGIITGSFYIHGYVAWNPLATFRAQIVGNEALGYYISTTPNAVAPRLIGAMRFYSPQ